MIYCVQFSDVVEHLRVLGFRQVALIEGQVIFRGPRNEIAIIRESNVNGHLPETIVNHALETARIEPPKWKVFWCD